MYHSLPMSYTELLPILIQNYGISVILASPKRPIQKSTMSIAYVNTIEELDSLQRQGSIPDLRRSDQIQRTCQWPSGALR